MLPFCGYHMGDYFAHWMEMGRRISNPPRIYHVNWFRKSSAGAYLWPGYGENLRVLKWVVERVRGQGRAVETPLGCMPTLEDLDLSGLNLGLTQGRELLSIDSEAWHQELADQKVFFEKLGARLPREISSEAQALAVRLK